MIDLCRKFYEFKYTKKIIDLDFIKRYVNYLLGLYEAKEYVKNVKKCPLLDGSNACYLYGEKEIIYSIDNMIYDIEDAKESPFDHNDVKDIGQLNLEILFAITHECFHAIQKKKMDHYGDLTLSSIIFNDSYIVCKKTPELYETYYEYMPIEVNAEISGKLAAINFANVLLDERIVKYNNSVIMEEILDIITDKDGNIFAPTECFYKLLGISDRYDDLMKKCKLSNYKRLILGLPLDDPYISSLFSISERTEETEDLKTYLKKK